VSKILGGHQRANDFWIMMFTALTEITILSLRRGRKLTQERQLVTSDRCAGDFQDV
jgi:hypothetical protein